MTGRTLTRGEKLEALTTLNCRSGIKQPDYHDIGLWSKLAGPRFDVSVFSDKTIERIDALYSQFFME